MEAVIIHAKDTQGNPVDVSISYDLLDIIWDRNSGILYLRHKNDFFPKFGTGQPVDDHGPAIEGHEIRVVKKIEEEKQ